MICDKCNQWMIWATQRGLYHEFAKEDPARHCHHDPVSDAEIDAILNRVQSRMAKAEEAKKDKCLQDEVDRLKGIIRQFRSYDDGGPSFD